MKVFTSKQFIEKLNWLVYVVPNYYYSANGTYCNYNHSNGKFMMDCVVSIKGLLWGFSADKNKPHGGAVLRANGVADFTPDGGLNHCTGVSNNFKNLIPGEYLCMKGTGYSHAGVYLGDGKVFECTTGWGANKCIISDINSEGVRSYKGKKNLRWTYHGKLNYIDYNDKPVVKPKVNVYYKVKTREDGWLPEVENRKDYAGEGHNSIIGVMVKVDRGSVWYQAHIKNVGWLPRVTGYNEKDFTNGWAGDDRTIDCVRIYYYTPEDIIKKYGYQRAKYRINGLPWVYDTEKCKNGDNFAGTIGRDAYRLEIEIE